MDQRQGLQQQELKQNQTQQQQQQLYHYQSNNNGDENNTIKEKRNQFVQEIRDKSRNDIIKKQRLQALIQKQKAVFKPKYLNAEDVSNLQKQGIELIKQWNPDNQYNNKVLEGLKYLWIQDVNIFNQFPLLQDMAQLLETSNDIEVKEQTMYLLNNAIYMEDEQSLKNNRLKLCDIIMGNIIKCNSVSLTDDGINSLANLMASLGPIPQNISHFLQSLVEREIKRITPDFVQGMVWLLRNLSNLDFDPTVSIKVFSLLWNHIQDSKDGSIQEDFLITMKNITQFMSEDELFYLIETNVGLVIQLFSYNWDPSLHPTLAKTIRNLLCGSDSMLESVLQLGLTDTLNILLESQDQNTVAETLGCITNFLLAEDEELIEQMVSGLKKPLHQQLMQFLQSDKYLEVYQEALSCVSQMVKAINGKNEELVKFGLIKIIIQSLSEKVENLIIYKFYIYLIKKITTACMTDCVQCLISLIEWEFSINQDESQVKQEILFNQGQKILGALLHLEDDNINEWVAKLLDMIGAE